MLTNTSEMLISAAAGRQKKKKVAIRISLPILEQLFFS